VDGFKSISRDVRGLHIVLEAIKEHWGQNPFTTDQKQNLKILPDGCVESLHELKNALKDHQSLGMFKKRLKDRWTWAAKNFAPLGNDLLSLLYTCRFSIIP
jgi:hypothetical protein